MCHRAESAGPCKVDPHSGTENKTPSSKEAWELVELGTAIETSQCIFNPCFYFLKREGKKASNC